MVQTTEAKASYPRIPAKNWWDLRRRFRQSPPRLLDVGYLQTVLNLFHGAAKNLLPSLKSAGLIDDAGQPTQRAMDWREDGHYGRVCQEIRQEVYPQDLLDALPPPKPDREQVERWFARETKTGVSAAGQMAAFYLLVSEAEAASGERAPESRARQERSVPLRRSGTSIHSPRRRGTPPPTPAGDPDPLPPTRRLDHPVVHIDLNIHIDSVASSEQIDQVFASIAHHLYGRGA